MNAKCWLYLLFFKEDSSKFVNQFRGFGYDQKLERKEEKHTAKPNKLIITEMIGPGMKSQEKFRNNLI